MPAPHIQFTVVVYILYIVLRCAQYMYWGHRICAIIMQYNITDISFMLCFNTRYFTCVINSGLLFHMTLITIINWVLLRGHLFSFVFFFFLLYGHTFTLSCPVYRSHARKVQHLGAGCGCLVAVSASVWQLRRFMWLLPGFRGVYQYVTGVFKSWFQMFWENFTLSQKRVT